MTRDPHLKALVLDAGNTKVRVVGWRGGDQDPRLRRGKRATELAPLPTLGVVRNPGVADETRFVEDLVGIREPYGNLPVVLTSVVPRIEDLLRTAWPELVVVDHRMELPFRLTLPQPETIGADRLCNVATAAVQPWRRALIVDAGTATTFDLLLDGEFVGGLIAPGMAFAAACLGERAARLAPVPFAACPLQPGSDTASAMQGGAYHVGRDGVLAVIRRLRRKYGPLPVMLTGGLGHMLQGRDRAWDPDWTSRGAAILTL